MLAEQDCINRANTLKKLQTTRQTLLEAIFVAACTGASNMVRWHIADVLDAINDAIQDVEENK